LRCVREIVYLASCPGAQESQGSLPRHGGLSCVSWSSFCSLACAFRVQSGKNGKLRRCCTGPWGRSNIACKFPHHVLQNPQKAVSLSLSTQDRRPCHRHPSHPLWSRCWLSQLLQPHAEDFWGFQGSFCCISFLVHLVQPLVAVGTFCLGLTCHCRTCPCHLFGKGQRPWLMLETTGRAAPEVAHCLPPKWKAPPHPARKIQVCCCGKRSARSCLQEPCSPQTLACREGGSQHRIR